MKKNIKIKLLQPIVYYLFFNIVFICFLNTMSAYSQDLSNKKLEISINGGALLSGKVEGSYHINFEPDSTIEIRNKVSPLIKIVADYNLTSRFSIGLNINYAKFNIDDILYKGKSIKKGDEVYLGTWDGRKHIIPFDDIKMFEINASVKWRFIFNNNMVLKPCLYIGFRKTFSSSLDAEEKGVVINYNAEYQYYLTHKYFLIADFGFISQPYGGVEDVGYVRSSGVSYFTLGLGIAL